MTRLTPYSLCRALLRAAERHDVSPLARAQLAAAGATLAEDLLRDDRTPHRQVVALSEALRAAEQADERTVH